MSKPGLNWEAILAPLTLATSAAHMVVEMSRIIDVAKASGLAVHRKSSDRYVALCCFHAERSPSMTLRPSLDAYHCFSCGAKGGYVALAKRLGVDLDVVLPRDPSAPARRSLPAPLKPPPTEKRVDESTLRILAELPDHTSDLDTRRYVERRGLNASDRVRFVDCASPLITTRFGKPGLAFAAGLRLVGLLYDMAGNVSGAQLRNLLDGERRVFDVIGSGSFGSRTRINPAAQQILLVESLTDYFAAEAAFDGPCTPVIGGPGAATLYRLLEPCSFPPGVKVLILFDRDEAGDAAAREVAKLVRRTGGLPYRAWPATRDARHG
jgi:hypothetical protein